MRFGRVLSAVCATAAVFASTDVVADDALVVSRDEALRLGAKAGPGVATAHAPLAGLHDAKDAAGSLLVLPPQLTLQGGPQVLPAAPPNGARVDATFGATAMMLFPLRGVGSARKDVADASIQVASQGSRRARMDAALRAAVAWSHVLEVKEIHKLRVDALVQAQSLADVAKKRIGAGVGQPAEQALALGEVGAQRVALLEAEGWMTEAFAELRLAIGLESRAHLEVAGDLCAKEPSPVSSEDAARKSAFDASPEVPLAGARAELARRDTRLVSAVLGPTFGLGAAYQRDGAGDHIVQGVISLPIPIADYGAFDRARTGALAAAATADVERVRAELDRDVAIAIHDVSHSREVKETLETAALVPLEDALRLAKVQYETGTQDVTLVLATRQRTIAAREAHARACGEVLRADLRFLRVTGALAKESP